MDNVSYKDNLSTSNLISPDWNNKVDVKKFNEKLKKECEEIKKELKKVETGDLGLFQK